MNASHTFRGLFAVLTLATLAACDDDTTGPQMTMVSVDVQSIDFGTLDVDFGAGLPQTVTVTNDGSSAVAIQAPSVSGSAAPEFALTGPSARTTVAAGSSLELQIAYDPSSTGSGSAQLEIPVDGGATIMVALVGTGADFTFRQVDRVGIPALNTVFNHPPAFSKIDYNTASPSDDLTTYTGRFETVLGAVANPDPSGTAALLLPDALPVSLSSATNFGTLTGRALSDDAVDVALGVTVGIESLKSDNVDSNDVAFLGTFPYLAQPNN